MQRIPRRQFTDDFKSQAVVLAESVGTAKAARQLDISANSITPGGSAPDPQARHLLGESIALQQRQIALEDGAVQKEAGARPGEHRLDQDAAAQQVAQL